VRAYTILGMVNCIMPLNLLLLLLWAAIAF
jgi:hypothetical protein